MRVVLEVVWLLALCLTVTAQETAQRFDTNGGGKPDQWEHRKPGSEEPCKVESDTDGNVESVWESPDQ